MPKFIDLTGQRFGKLTVVSRTSSTGKGAFWNVKCDCGTTKVVRADRLNQQLVKSCGCAIADSNRSRATHGQSAVRTKLYHTWSNMKDRCLNPSSTHYHRYGGRGITVHQGWVDDFAAFAADVGEPPARGLTLDRIDNSRGYEPGNVRWASRKEQANNRDTNVLIEYQGATKTLTGWAEALGYKIGMLRSRWKKGLRGDDLFAPPLYIRGAAVTFNGESHHLGEWSRRTGIPYVTLYWRHKTGKPLI